MQFQYGSDIRRPSKKHETTTWDFQADLRNMFPTMDSNNEICQELRKRGVIMAGDDIDAEFSCSYVYFKSKSAAWNFIVRLNNQPEIKSYTPPVAVEMVSMQEQEWKKLKAFLKATLTPEQHTALTALDIKLYGDDKKVYVAADEVVIFDEKEFKSVC